MLLLNCRRQMVRTKNAKSDKQREPSYCVPEEKHFRARVNQGSRLSMLANIDNYVDPYDWDKLLDNQFSGIILLGNQCQFSSQLVHYDMLAVAIFHGRLL